MSEKKTKLHKFRTRESLGRVYCELKNGKTVVLTGESFEKAHAGKFDQKVIEAILKEAGHL